MIRKYLTFRHLFYQGMLDFISERHLHLFLQHIYLKRPQGPFPCRLFIKTSAVDINMLPALNFEPKTACHYYSMISWTEHFTLLELSTFPTYLGIYKNCNVLRDTSVYLFSFLPYDLLYSQQLCYKF
jgi:hypothetical protein